MISYDFLKLEQANWSYLFLFFKISFPSGDCGLTHLSLFAVKILGERRAVLEQGNAMYSGFIQLITHMISVRGQKLLGSCMTGSACICCLLILPANLKHLHVLDLLAGCPVGRKDHLLSCGAGDTEQQMAPVAMCITEWKGILTALVRQSNNNVISSVSQQTQPGTSNDYFK